MRVISLLPSATETIAALGLAHDLVGRSNECTYPPGVMALPVVTAARIDPRDLESLEIDRHVRAALAVGRSLYAVDAALIDDLRPDVIVTQDLCAVCAVSSSELGTACPVGAEIVSLDPSTLDEVAASIEVLATRLGAAERGTIIAGEMPQAIHEVRSLAAIAPHARVVAVDGDAYFSRPGPRLADGVRELGHLLHPSAVPDPGVPLIELARPDLS